MIFPAKYPSYKPMKNLVYCPGILQFKSGISKAKKLWHLFLYQALVCISTGVLVRTMRTSRQRSVPKRTKKVWWGITLCKNREFPCIFMQWRLWKIILTHVSSSHVNLLLQKKMFTQEKSSIPTGLVCFTNMAAVRSPSPGAYNYPRPIYFCLNLSRTQIPTGIPVTNDNHKHGLVLTDRHDVDRSTWCWHVHVGPHCFILTKAYLCRLVLAYFAGKIDWLIIGIAGS